MSGFRLSDELKEYPNIAESVNLRLFAVCQMMMVADIFMADIEDMLNEHGKYRYSIKKEHSSIANHIKSLMKNVWQSFGKDEQDNFTLDNIDLCDIVKAWSGLSKEYLLCLRPRTEGTKYTMTINPAGDIFLRDENGWIITLPKAIAEKGGVINETYDKASASPEGIEVDVDLFIRDKDYTK